MIKKYFQKIELITINKLNKYSIKNKVLILYIITYIFPLIITDSIIFLTMYKSEQTREINSAKSIADNVEFTLLSKFNDAQNVATNIYLSRIMNDFLDTSYVNHMDYYSNYYLKMNDSIYKNYNGLDNLDVTFFTNNSTILSGGDFLQIQNIISEPWYIEHVNSLKNTTYYIYFDESKYATQDSRRKISIICNLDYFKNSTYQKVVKVDLNYDSIIKNMVNANYSNKVYVCSGNRVIFSNDSSYTQNNDYKVFREWEDVAYSSTFYFKENKLDILIKEEKQGFSEDIKDQIGLISFLFFINIVLPILFFRLLNRSFVERLEIISSTFSKSSTGELIEISEITGNDEISEIMNDYNYMANRINELINQVYIKEIKQREIDIARQNAELLALHSQINPHFLFNALESIRMGSVIKNEVETADMIGALAKMQRKYVEWDDDKDKIAEEIEVTRAYLELQKNRFGSRLAYEIDVDEECLIYKIPKLSILTFVENSCVHGVEGKSQSVWIFVRIHKKNDYLIIEIEDTGKGIDSEKQKSLLKKMYDSNISTIKKQKHIGVANACLRINMITSGNACFELESEVGVGTIVTIKIPIEYL